MTETLVQFLTQVKDLVEAMAKSLLKGVFQRICRRSPSFNVYPGDAQVEYGHNKKEVLTEAAAIVASGTWSPLFVMIDKSRAELNAILIGKSLIYGHLIFW